MHHQEPHRSHASTTTNRRPATNRSKLGNNGRRGQAGQLSASMPPKKTTPILRAPISRRNSNGDEDVDEYEERIRRKLAQEKDRAQGVGAIHVKEADDAFEERLLRKTALAAAKKRSQDPPEKSSDDTSFEEKLRRKLAGETSNSRGGRESMDMVVSSVHHHARSAPRKSFDMRTKLAFSKEKDANYTTVPTSSRDADDAKMEETLTLEEKIRRKIAQNREGGGGGAVSKVTKAPEESSKAPPVSVSRSRSNESFDELLRRKMAMEKVNHTCDGSGTRQSVEVSVSRSRSNESFDELLRRKMATEKINHTDGSTTIQAEGIRTRCHSNESFEERLRRKMAEKTSHASSPTEEERGVEGGGISSIKDTEYAGITTRRSCDSLTDNNPETANATNDTAATAVVETLDEKIRRKKAMKEKIRSQLNKKAENESSTENEATEGGISDSKERIRLQLKQKAARRRRNNNHSRLSSSMPPQHMVPSHDSTGESKERRKFGKSASMPIDEGECTNCNIYEDAVDNKPSKRAPSSVPRRGSGSWWKCSKCSFFNEIDAGMDDTECICYMCKSPKMNTIGKGATGPIKRVLKKEVSFKMNPDGEDRWKVDSWSDLGGVMETTRHMSSSLDDYYNGEDRWKVDSWSDLGGVLETTRHMSSSLDDYYIPDKDVIVENEEQDEEDERHRRAQRRDSETKFSARAIKAHGLANNDMSAQDYQSTRPTATTATTADDFDTTKEEFQKRMRRRSIRRGLGKTLSSRVIADSIKDEKQHQQQEEMSLREDDLLDESARSNIVSNSIEKYSSMIRSCSSGNLCPGSWECSICTFINEPVGLDPCTFCKVCNEPNVQRCPGERGLTKESSFVLLDGDDCTADFVESWSDLGGVLAKTISKSRRRSTARRSTLTESWFCGQCTYENMDEMALFCGACGKPRIRDEL